MLPTTLVLSALVGAAAVVAQQRPPPPAYDSTPYSTNCQNITFKQNWLVADCPKTNGTDNSTTITRSSLFLPQWIGRRNGNLTFTKSGHYEASWLHGCSLKNDTILDCDFYLYRTPNDTETESSQLDLTTCIENRDGLLFSCEDNWDQVPKVTNYTVPDDFTITAGLIDGNCSTSSALLITTTEPADFGGICYAWTRSGHRSRQKDGAVILTPNPGWELIAYNTDSCTGEVGRVDPDDGDTCQVFPFKAGSFALRPLWPSGSWTSPYVSSAKKVKAREAVERKGNARKMVTARAPIKPGKRNVKWG